MNNDDMALVTKGFLRQETALLRKELRDETASLRKEFRESIQNVAKEMLLRFAAVDRRCEEMTRVIKLSHSEIMKRLDGFMAKTIKVERDQLILIHRVDRLEKKTGLA